MPRKLSQKQHFALADKLFEERPDLKLSQKLKIIYHITMFHAYDAKVNAALRKQQKHAKLLNSWFKSPEMLKHYAEI